MKHRTAPVLVSLSDTDFCHFTANILKMVRQNVACQLEKYQLDESFLKIKPRGCSFQRTLESIISKKILHFSDF